MAGLSIRVAPVLLARGTCAHHGALLHMDSPAQSGEPVIRELHQSLHDEDFDDDFLAAHLPVLGANKLLREDAEVAKLFEDLSQLEGELLSEGLDVLQKKLGLTASIQVLKDWPADIPTKERKFLAHPKITNKRTNPSGGRASGSGIPKRVERDVLPGYTYEHYIWRRYNLRCYSAEHTHSKACASLGHRVSTVHEDSIVYSEDKVLAMGLDPSDENKWERITLKSEKRFGVWHGKAICRPTWMPTLITEELQKGRQQGAGRASQHVKAVSSMLRVEPSKEVTTEHGRTQRQQQPQEEKETASPAAAPNKRRGQPAVRGVFKQQRTATDPNLPQQQEPVSSPDMLHVTLDSTRSNALVHYQGAGPLSVSAAGAAGLDAATQVWGEISGAMAMDTTAAQGTSLSELLDTIQLPSHPQVADMQPGGASAIPSPASGAADCQPAVAAPVAMLRHVNSNLHYTDLYQQLRDAMRSDSIAGVASFQALLGFSPRIQLFKILQQFDQYQRSLLQLLVTPTYRWGQPYYGEECSSRFNESGEVQLTMLRWLCSQLPTQDMMQLLAMTNSVSFSAGLHTAARHAVERTSGHKMLELLLHHSKMEHMVQHTKGNYLALQCAARSRDVDSVELLLKHAEILLLGAGLDPASVQVLLFQREDPWFQSAGAAEAMRQACDRIKTVPEPLPPDNQKGRRHVSTAMQLLIEVSAQACRLQRHGSA